MTAVLPQWTGPSASLKQPASTVANILLPFDGTPLARAALPVGRRLAQLYQATPHLLNVGQQSREPKELLAVLGLTSEDISGAVLDGHQGDAADVIIRAAQQLPHSLVVMCTHSESARNPDSFGRVVESVLASGIGRIVLLAPERGDKPWNPRRILLAHDGTPNSDAATAPAAEVAQRAAAEVIALHVAARKVSTPGEPGSLPAPRYIDQPQHEWPAWTNGFMDRMLALGAPLSAVHFDLVVTGGQPGSEIADIASRQQVDLVVMACDANWISTKHGATRVVVRNCGCPVLLVCPGMQPGSGAVGRS